MTTRSVLSSPPSRSSGPGPTSQDPSLGTGVASGRRRIASVLRSFHTPVRGHAFAAAPAGASTPEAGLRARLAREPSNPADPMAVAVWVEADDDRTWRIGYLDRGVAARVAPRLDAGHHVDACVEGWVSEPRGRWHRPLVRLVPDTSAVGHGEERGTAAPLWGRPPGVSRRLVRSR